MNLIMNLIYILGSAIVPQLYIFDDHVAVALNLFAKKYVVYLDSRYSLFSFYVPEFLALPPVFGGFCIYVARYMPGRHLYPSSNS